VARHLQNEHWSSVTCVQLAHNWRDKKPARPRPSSTSAGLRTFRTLKGNPSEVLSRYRLGIRLLGYEVFLRGEPNRLAVKSDPLRTGEASCRAGNVPLPGVAPPSFFPPRPFFFHPLPRVGNVIDLRVSPVLVRQKVRAQSSLTADHKATDFSLSHRGRGDDVVGRPVAHPTSLIKGEGQKTLAQPE